MEYNRWSLLEEFSIVCHSLFEYEYSLRQSNDMQKVSNKDSLFVAIDGNISLLEIHIERNIHGDRNLLNNVEDIVQLIPKRLD